VKGAGPLFDRHAELAWSASWQPVGIPASKAVDLPKVPIPANCLALKQVLEQ
jgi:hypothetical protein